MWKSAGLNSQSSADSLASNPLSISCAMKSSTVVSPSPTHVPGPNAALNVAGSQSSMRRTRFVSPPPPLPDPAVAGAMKPVTRTVVVTDRPNTTRSLRMSDPCRLMRPRPAAQSQSRPATPAVTTLIQPRCRGLPDMSGTSDAAAGEVHLCLSDSRHLVHRDATDSDRTDDVGDGSSAPMTHSHRNQSAAAANPTPDHPNGVEVKQPIGPHARDAFRLARQVQTTGTAPASDEVEGVRRAELQPPTLGGLGFSKRAPRVAPWGSTGWELPVRRKWYGVNHGRRPRPGPTFP